ncbi:MAG TPA: hypothetical protein VKX28_13010 [Xanthobacteraceae bacterium]|nr:hypothetical protein [Xanthobacteraceae bacterium]
MTNFKLKWHAMAGVATLAIGIVAGSAMDGSVARQSARAAAGTFSPMDMMVAARGLPDQVVDTPF